MHGLDASARARIAKQISNAVVVIDARAADFRQDAAGALFADAIGDSALRKVGRARLTKLEARRAHARAARFRAMESKLALRIGLASVTDVLKRCEHPRALLQELIDVERIVNDTRLVSHGIAGARIKISEALGQRVFIQHDVTSCLRIAQRWHAVAIELRSAMIEILELLPLTLRVVDADRVGEGTAQRGHRARCARRAGSVQSSSCAGALKPRRAALSDVERGPRARGRAQRERKRCDPQRERANDAHASEP